MPSVTIAYLAERLEQAGLSLGSGAKVVRLCGWSRGDINFIHIDVMSGSAGCNDAIEVVSGLQPQPCCS